MRKSDGVALSLIVAGLLVFSLTSAGIVSLSTTVGGTAGQGGGGTCPVSLTGATPEYGYVYFAGGACTASGAIAPAGTVIYYSLSGPGVSESGQTQVSGSEGQFSGSVDVPYSANGIYAVVASVCQDAASSCAAYPSGGTSSVSLTLGSGQTSTTTSRPPPPPSAGPSSYIGYWLSLALIVSGVLVFVSGFVYRRGESTKEGVARILGAYLVLTGVGALVLSAIPGLSGVFALQPVSLPTLLLLPQSVESSLAGAFLTGPPSMWASFVMFAVDALVGLGLMLPG